MGEGVAGAVRVRGRVRDAVAAGAELGLVPHPCVTERVCVPWMPYINLRACLARE